MPDDNTQADEAADTAQGAVDDTGSGTPAPWGDDFNPDRAWKTITHLREFEKPAQRFSKLEQGDDPDTFRALAEKYGYELADDDDGEDDDLLSYEDDTETDDPIQPVVQRLSKLEDAIQERDNRAALDAAVDHVKELAKGKEIELSERERKWILQESIDGGFTPQATEKAFQAHLEWLEERGEAAVKKYAKTKRAPHVSPGGKAATNAPNLDDHKQRQAWMAERMAELAAGE